MVGLLLLAAIVTVAYFNREEVIKAFVLLRNVRPHYLLLALGAVLAGFVCAGQIYGRALIMLGHRARFWWLTAAALVTILINQAIPVGTMGAYAFLVASLRRRGFPVGSVAMVAGMELLSWNGAVLVAFSYGLIYLLITTGLSGASVSYGALAVALGVMGGAIYVASRPDETLQQWALRLKRVVNRLFGPVLTAAQVTQAVDEILASRRLILEQPRRIVMLVGLQLLIFCCHSLALLAILHSLGADPPIAAIFAAYGLTLIVSVFTLLPGGGGTVEAALTVALHAQGVPLEAALGAAILFRLISFWTMLPVGIICYRLLTRSSGSS
ncbi:MAG: lysylphosphatidylglycerol synthase transmembrane domain-containing protein [Roseiflexus sp.]